MGRVNYHYIITIQWAAGPSGWGTRTEEGVTEIDPGETRSAVFGRLRKRAHRNAAREADRRRDPAVGTAGVVFFSLEPEDLQTGR
jgi:hypothetical protein